MAIKTKYFQKPENYVVNMECFKIVKKTYAYKNIVDETDEVVDSINDRLYPVYETTVSSYDVSEYIDGDKIWEIPENVDSEIIKKKILGVIPNYKILKEGFIFSYTREGIEEFVKMIKHNRDLYGKNHFGDDLRIYHCVIPSGYDFYSGFNEGKPAYASKGLRFVKDVTNDLFDED